MSTEAASYGWDGSAFRIQTSLPIADRGFRYGMSIFETIALRAGRPLFPREHLDRLRAAAAAAALPIPPHALEAAETLLKESRLTGVARIFLTAGPGEFDAPSIEPAVIVSLQPRTPPARPSKGYALWPDPQPAAAPLPGLKTGNYWANILALGTARRAGCNEAILVNPRRRIVSAAMANLFVLGSDGLCTPPCADGARPGVIREWVMQQQPVAERSLTVQDLETAREVFLTSSGIGVMPVGRIGEKRLSSRHFADALHREYEAVVSA